MVKRPPPPFRVSWLLILLVIIGVKPVYAADWLYSMKPGDTLWSVCQQYAKESGCWQKLGPFNKIDKNRKIPPGTRIRMPASWLKVPAATATIAFVQGDAKYQLLGETAANAKAGVKLPIGSQLTTGQGSVSVLFADGSSMLLESDSQLVLDTLSHFESNGMVDSTVRLNRGTVKTRVIKREPRSQFRTITPSAVASVRGTEYRVNVISGQQDATPNKQNAPHETTPKTTAKDSTLIEVYQGLVDVGAERKTYPVPASFGIITEQGHPPQPPVKLLEKPIFNPFNTAQTLVTVNSSKPVSNPTYSPILISWQAMAAATRYQLNVLADQVQAEQAEQLIQVYRANSTQVNLTNLNVGCYQLSLRAIDKLGLHGLETRQRLCLDAQINAPKLNTQNIEYNNLNQATIRWNDVSGALAYRIEVSDKPDFTQLINNIETSNTSHSLSLDSALFVRVQALDKNGSYSNFSSGVSLKPKPIEKVAEPEYWPIYLQIGLAILALF